MVSLLHPALTFQQHKHQNVNQLILHLVHRNMLSWVLILVHNHTQFCPTSFFLLASGSSVVLQAMTILFSWRSNINHLSDFFISLTYNFRMHSKFLLNTGPKVFGIGYCNWDVAVDVCRKAMAISRSLVPVPAGRTNCILILLNELLNYFML